MEKIRDQPDGDGKQWVQKNVAEKGQYLIQRLPLNQTPTYFIYEMRLEEVLMFI